MSCKPGQRLNGYRVRKWAYCRFTQDYAVRVSESVRNPRARNCGARGKPGDLQVIALNIDDDVGRAARGSILDVEIPARIQRADEGTVLGRTGHNRDHSAHWRIGRADQNIATGASGIWISDAPDNGVCICRNRVATHRDPADLVGSGGSAIEMLAIVGVAAAGPGIDKTRGRGKDRLRAWTRGAGRTGRSLRASRAGRSGKTGCASCPIRPIRSVRSVRSVGSRRASRSGCASWPGRTTSRKRSCAELSVSVDENRITAALIDSVYSSDEGCCLRAGLPDADRIGLARNVG